MSNPYQPPTSQVHDIPPERRPAPVRAVVAGIAVDQVGTLLSQLVIGAVYGVILAKQGHTQEEIRQIATGASQSSIFYISILVLGFCWSILGGFICARISYERIYRSALVMALLEILVVVILNHKIPDLKATGIYLLNIASILGGAWLWQMKSRPSASA